MADRQQKDINDVAQEGMGSLSTGVLQGRKGAKIGSANKRIVDIS